MATILLHPRLENAVFASYAWRCETLPTTPSLAELLPQDSPILRLAQKLDLLEQEKYLIGDTEPFALFVVSMNGFNSTVDTPTNQHTATFRILQAYRAVDVFVRGPRVGSAVSGHAYLSKCSRIDPALTLNDIGKWARNLTTHITEDLLADKCVLLRPSDTKIPGIYLLKQMAQCQTKRASLSLLWNLLGCAIHLQIFMHGVHYLPKNFSECLDLTGASADDMKTLADLQDLLFPKGDTSALQKPLAYALSCSPIVIAGSRNCMSDGASAWIMEVSVLSCKASVTHVAQAWREIERPRKFMWCEKYMWVHPEEMRGLETWAEAFASLLNASTNVHGSGGPSETVSPAQLSLTPSVNGKRVMKSGIQKTLTFFTKIGSPTRASTPSEISSTQPGNPSPNHVPATTVNAVDSTEGGTGISNGSNKSPTKRFGTPSGESAENGSRTPNPDNQDPPSENDEEDPPVEDGMPPLPTSDVESGNEGVDGQPSDSTSETNDTDSADEGIKKRKGKRLRGPDPKKKRPMMTPDEALEAALLMTTFDVRNKEVVNEGNDTKQELLSFEHLLDDSLQRNRCDTLPETSAVEVLSKEKYAKLSVPEIQALLKKKHILLERERTDVEQPITLETLRQLGSVEAPITVVGPDMTIETDDGHAFRSSTLVEMMKNLNRKDAKPVRVLPISLMYDPFQKAPGVCEPYASEQWAWEEVKGKSYCDRNTPYPLPQMRWGSLSTAGAYETWKMTGGGRGTLLRVERGTLLCFLLVARNGGPGVKDAHWAHFNGNEFDVGFFDVELVCLRSGETLVMRPNQVYRLITGENTVARGAHYYATTTLADTVAALYHEFIIGSRIAKDDDHETSMGILTHLITLYHRNLTVIAEPPSTLITEKGMRNMDHIPDITDWDGFIGVLSLCIFLELYTAMTRWAYNAKTPPRLWRRAVHNRKLARDIMDWIFNNHAFSNATESVVTPTEAREVLFHQTLGRTAAALIQYKKKAEKAGRQVELANNRGVIVHDRYLAKRLGLVKPNYMVPGAAGDDEVVQDESQSE
ncbi:hypothetical protein H0H93_014252 [Arthromyces matolae]|nr:hypothetical protein H0H93_014252 [Arthromyces matolae]